MPDSTVGGLPQAEKPISEITETTTLGNNDLLLVEQSGNARKIKGQHLKQYFNANVVSAEANAIEPTQDPTATYNSNTNTLILNLPSADYIVSITKTGRSGLVDTYTVTTALGYTTTFDVINGGGSPASETPLADVAGGAVGTSEKWAREDHRHPFPTAAQVEALALAGNQYLVNPVDDLSNYATGIALFNNATSRPVSNFPYDSTVTQWALVVSGKADAGTVFQVAWNLLGGSSPRFRNCASGTWTAWKDVNASLYEPVGTLGIASGGTGATTAAAALANLGITDSGWIEVTFTSEFQNYGSTNRCQYRKVGNVVTVCGAATPVNDIAGSNTQYTMFTLPVGFRPKVVMSSIQQGSGDARWQMQIGSGNGAVTFSRYADDTGYITANGGSPGAWLVFSATFLTA